ncbi:MAG: glycosyltransferase family 9 protein [Planctomycetes bacterium]|nr:glycosyltransferase family 9 protein [Planctomycetota bacterium]
MIHALPVLHGLRERFPRATIDWLIASSHAPLLENHDKLDELVLFDRHGLLAGRTGFASLVSFLRDLRSRRYDLVVDLQGLFRTGFFARVTGAPVRIGFRDAREGAWMFYTHYLARDPIDTHAVDRNYRVAELLGFDDVPITFRLPISDTVRAKTCELLRDRGVGDHEPLVVVAPGARWETKRWAPERFAEAIDGYSARVAVRTVLVGSREEVSVCDAVIRACRPESQLSQSGPTNKSTMPVNLAGKTTLGCVAALIERSDLVLCHDSAAMHLAVALGRPLVCIVGPTNPHRTGPYRRLQDVLRLALDCSPCYFRRLAQCDYGHRCMTDLTSGVVADAVCARLPNEAARTSAGVLPSGGQPIAPA